MGAAALVALQSAIAPFPSGMGAVISTLLITTALAALLLPARGAHTRMAATRDEELARVRERIRAERDSNLAGAGAPDARLANLLAYEQRIAHASTWPFDLSTYLRFGLYVSIGLGSWLGAALVERVVDLFLD